MAVSGLAFGRAAAGGAHEAALDGYVLEDHVGFLLRRAHQRHATLFQEGIGAADLTPTQFAALFKVVDHGRVTQNQLGRLTAMDPATIQGVVKRLMARGYVLRELDPLDRRTVVVTPTASGVDAAARAVACARCIAEATLQPLDADERTHLLSLLRRIA